MTLRQIGMTVAVIAIVAVIALTAVNLLLPANLDPGFFPKISAAP